MNYDTEWPKTRGNKTTRARDLQDDALRRAASIPEQEPLESWRKDSEPLERCPVEDEAASIAGEQRISGKPALERCETCGHTEPHLPFLNDADGSTLLCDRTGCECEITPAAPEEP